MTGASTPYRFDFHTMTSWSDPPDAKKWPSLENRAQLTGPAWPCSVKSRRPSRRSQIFSAESFDADSR